MALAERMLTARWGEDLVDHRTFVLTGDGCLMEGMSHEAIDLAGYLGFGRLVVFWDDNSITIEGDYIHYGIREHGISALMRQPVVYVMTHDRIGLGEDGRTHLPVEHLASLRAMPNLTVIRPCDAVETAEAWAVAVASADRPTVLCLSRQNLPAVRTTHTDENVTARGAYLLRDAEARDATLVATGSGPALYAHLGITAEAVAEAARRAIRA